MTSATPIWAPDLNAESERENRLSLALLNRAVNNLKANRLVIPIFAAAICPMFPQWVPWPSIALWYGQVWLGLLPLYVVLSRIPAKAMDRLAVRRWTRILTAANLFFALNWISMAWHFWAGADKHSNHIMIELILGCALAAHSVAAAPCRGLARPLIALYFIAMVLTPLQDFDLHSFFLALGTPFFTGFIAYLASQQYGRSKAAIRMAEERNSLLAELVMAKLESDRGRERAEAASVAKSQFLANMSHELRTPLNAILGFSEVIATRIFEHDRDRNAEYAKLIHSSGHHLLALINDILDLAKIEAGRWKLEEAELDLYRVAEDCLQLVAWRAKDTNAVLENAIPPGLQRLYADERAIKQILLNLLSNAAKFTPEQGRITAFAGIEPDGTLAFGVADTGVGISPEDQARVFDSFGQGKHDVAIADKGTGLGLAIVKGLVESHGGLVRLTSEVGRGTQVTVVLPASRVRGAVTLPPVREPAHFVA